MRRYANQSTKLGRFLARNHGQIWRGLRVEVATKLYLRPWFRTLVRPLFQVKEPENWVFLVGCYNSGTTILREILQAHPQISTLPFEGVRLTSAFPDLEESDWPRMMYHQRDKWPLSDAGATERVMASKQDWAPWWDKSASVYLEKSIDHTTRIDWLSKHFGNVKFVAITRNGYAVCEGVLRRSRPTGQATNEVGKTYPPEMAARQWQHLEELIVEHLDPARDAHLYYEELMADPITELTRVFQALGVSIPLMSWEGDVLSVGNRQYLLKDQNDSSIARLDPTTRKVLGREMQTMLSRHGYEPLD